MHSPLAVIELGDEAGGPFDLINGLPVHPLVVHSAVVLIPLTALGLLLMAVWPRFSRSLGWLVALGGLVAAGSAFVAKQSGEALEERVGEPGFDHAELGDVMPILALGLLVVTVILWWVDRSAPAEAAPAPRRGVRIAVAILAVLVALANLVWIYRVGDSGAKSVWSGRVAASTGNGDSGSTDDDDEDDAARPSGEPSATPAGGGSSPTYTIAQVAANNTPSDCWAAINGNVYDLTAWIDQHPGGAQRIIDLCGTDATSAFEGQHAGQSEPEQDLAQFRVGTLQ